MAVSNVVIGNLALQKLGQSLKLESLTQNHPNARDLNLAFAPTRDMLLRMYDWSFAIARDSIAADGDGPVWGDWNRYSLPADFIRLIRDDETGVRVDYKIEGLYILSANASPLEIRYVSRVEDPNYFDPTFVEAFACKLAHVTCNAITGSTSRQAAMEKQFGDAISEAKRLGAIEKDAQVAPEDDFILAML